MKLSTYKSIFRYLIVNFPETMEAPDSQVERMIVQDSQVERKEEYSTYVHICPPLDKHQIVFVDVNSLTDEGNDRKHL